MTDPTSPSETPSATVEPPRRNRWRRRVLGLLLAPFLLIATLLAGLGLMPTVYSATQAKEDLSTELTKLLKTKVTIEDFEYAPYSGATLRGLVVGPPPGFKEDVLRVDEVEVKYRLTDLWSRTVHVDALRMRSAQAVIELSEGRRNLDVLLQALSSTTGATEDKKDEPPTLLVGPLTPVNVVVHAVTVGPLAVELVSSEGRLSLEGLFFNLEGTVGRTEADVIASVGIRPRTPVNLQGRIGPEWGLPEPLEIESQLALEVKAALKADVADEILVKAVDVDVHVDHDGRYIPSGRTLPPMVFGAKMSAGLRPQDDRVMLSEATVNLHESEVLRASAGIEGLAALIRQQDVPNADHWIRQVGFLSKRDAPRVELAVPRMKVRLKQLQPFVTLFAPGVRLTGAVGAQDVQVAGALSKMLSRQPEVLAGTLGFEHVAVEMRPSDVAVRNIDGQLDLGRPGMPPGYGLSGQIDVTGVRAAGSKVRQGTVRFDGRVGRLGPPKMGPFDVGVTVDLKQLEAAGVRVGRCTVKTGLRGVDILQNAPTVAPTASATVTVEQIAVRTSTSAPLDVTRAELFAEVRLDRLDEVGRDPLELQARLTVNGIRGPSGLRVPKLRLDLEGRGANFKWGSANPDLTLRLRIPRFETEVVEGRKVDGQVVVTGRGLVERPLSTLGMKDPPGGLYPVPETLGVRFVGNIARVLGKGGLKGLDDPVAVEVRMVARPTRQRIALESARLSVGRFFQISAASTLTNVFRNNARVDLRVGLDELNLTELYASREIFRDNGMELAGRTTAELTYDGPMDQFLSYGPSLLGPFILAAEVALAVKLEDFIKYTHLVFPDPFTSFGLLYPNGYGVKSRLRVDFEDVSVAMNTPQMGLGLDKFRGHSELEFGQPGVSFDWAFHMDQASFQEDQVRVRFSDFEWKMQSGASDTSLYWKDRARLNELQMVAFQESTRLRGFDWGLDFSYTPLGDAVINDVHVRLPDLGFEAEVQGGVRRVEYGVLHPEVDLSLMVNADRIKNFLQFLRRLGGRSESLGKTLLPPVEEALSQLAPLSGQVSTHGTLTTVSDTQWDLQGTLALENLSYKPDRPWGLVGAVGRIPVYQSFDLSPPDYNMKTEVDPQACVRPRSNRTLQEDSGLSAYFSQWDRESQWEAFSEKYPWLLPDKGAPEDLNREQVWEEIRLRVYFATRFVDCLTRRDDLWTRLKALKVRAEKARVRLDPTSILAVAPRTADHDLLRPFKSFRGADLRAERVTYQGHELEDVRMEILWQAGVLRLDHFQAGLWGGDMVADLALQLTPDLDVKARLHSTITDLNLDIPYALATGNEPVPAEDAESYRTSGVMDLTFALRNREVNGRFEVTKLGLPLVERLFGALGDEDSGAVRALSLAERVGVRPVAAKIWIAQSLLNVQFDWKQLWIHVAYQSANPLDLLVDTVLIAARPALVLTLGSLYVIPTVNGAIRRFSISGFLEDAVVKSKVEQFLSDYEKRVTGGEAPAPPTPKDPAAVLNP